LSFSATTDHTSDVSEHGTHCSGSAKNPKISNGASFPYSTRAQVGAEDAEAERREKREHHREAAKTNVKP
jgi:hypothetical protein